MDNYVLNDDNSVSPEPDIRVWAENFEKIRINKRRIVGYDEIDNKRVSTVFLGLNHSWSGGSPEIFETMVFGGEGWSELYCMRYATWDEAKAGHDKLVQELKDGTSELCRKTIKLKINTNKKEE